jgi:hypothetical protein
VRIELVVLDVDEGAADVCRDVGEGDRLAVLPLEEGDQVAIGVVDPGRPGERR